MIDETERRRLERLAVEMRWNIVRMMGPGKAHHFGGSLSAADIMTALYFYKMRFDPRNPTVARARPLHHEQGPLRPRAIRGAGDAGRARPGELPTLKKMGSRLQGHPAMHETPGIEGCTGALGEGLSYANGMALAGRIQGLDYRVYCLLGDGELQEGQVWEAAMTAAKRCLGEVTAFLDLNQLKAMDESSWSKSMEPQPERWASFRLGSPRS